VREVEERGGVGGWSEIEDTGTESWERKRTDRNVCPTGNKKGTRDDLNGMQKNALKSVFRG
jgi:hypothetical protein